MFLDKIGCSAWSEEPLSIAIAEFPSDLAIDTEIRRSRTMVSLLHSFECGGQAALIP